MIFEVWDTKIDIERLRKHYRECVRLFEPTHQFYNYGGWSVLSSDGNYKDGWHHGYLLFENGQSPEIINQIKEIAKPSAEYRIPTEICHGYLAEIIQLLEEKKLSPHRARIIGLAAGTSSLWHQDCPSDTYMVRLHIPIFTNSDCFFETETGKAHLPADGSGYFLFVNNRHRVVNQGKHHRVHLVIDVIDSTGITKHHSLAAFQGRND